MAAAITQPFDAFATVFVVKQIYFLYLRIFAKFNDQPDRDSGSAGLKYIAHDHWALRRQPDSARRQAGCTVATLPPTHKKWQPYKT